MTAAMQKNLVPFLLRAAEGVVRCVFSSATLAGIAAVALSEIGRASCRERV